MVKLHIYQRTYVCISTYLAVGGASAVGVVLAFSFTSFSLYVCVCTYVDRWYKYIYIYIYIYFSAKRVCMVLTINGWITCGEGSLVGR